MIRPKTLVYIKLSRVPLGVEHKCAYGWILFPRAKAHKDEVKKNQEIQKQPSHWWG